MLMAVGRVLAPLGTDHGRVGELRRDTPNFGRMQADALTSVRANTYPR